MSLIRERENGRRDASSVRINDSAVPLKESNFVAIILSCLSFVVASGHACPRHCEAGSCKPVGECPMGSVAEY